MLVVGSTRSGATTNARRTVIVLVDESGTLKADRGGWRKEATSLLIDSLPDGSLMALSGFGEPGRKLELRPLPLDASPSGTASRRQLAATAQMLGDRDGKTDLYGAIGLSLAQFERLDPTSLRSAPPALIVLSDFQPDPLPSPEQERQVCDQLRRSGVQFLALGFGKVDKPRMQALSACSSGLPVATIAEPAGLLQAFWLLYRRLTNSLRVFDASAQASLAIPVPPWASELYVLGTSANRPASAWDWTVPGSMAGSAGRVYRIAKLTYSQGAARALEIAIRQPEGVQISVVARGDLVVRLTHDSPQPWLVGEFVRFAALLTDTRRKQPANEWIPMSKAESAAFLRLPDGVESGLLLDPDSGSFRGGAMMPPRQTFSARALVSVDGAAWDAPLEAPVRDAPVKLGAGGELMAAKAWLPGQTVRVSLESALDNRSFTLFYNTSARAGACNGQIQFDAGNRRGVLRVQAGPGRATWRDWLIAPATVTASLALKTVLENGQAVETPAAIPLLIPFYPTWLRLLLAALLLLPLMTLARVGVIGRRLPKWHLVACDTSGRTVASREPLRMAAYRKSLSLETFGIPRTALRRSLFGKTTVDLGPGVQLRPGGVDLGIVPATKQPQPLQVGDLLIYQPAAGAGSACRVEKF
jgi:hypothetical protein